MSTLKEILCAPGNRANVIRDVEALIDAEVASKSGISGLAIKAAYKTIKAVKPGVISEAVDSLLDRFVERLEPFHAEWIGANRTPGFDAFLSSRATPVANALLGVTDDRARTTTHTTFKKTYEMVRPHGEKMVVAAVPGLGRLIARYAK